MAKRSISIRGYHGSGLNGNNCNFFKASKDLYLLIGDKTTAPVTDMLEKFDKVTKACFSRELSSDWRIVLEEFKTSVWELISFSKFELNMEINVTWKLHLIVAHLRPFLEKTGKGLADYSEQTGESSTTRWTRICLGSNGNWRTLTMVRRCCLGPGGSTARGSEMDFNYYYYIDY